MDFNLRPHPSLAFTIKARIGTQSPQQVLNLTDMRGYQRAACNTPHNVLLTHPPVLLIKEGGGPMLLNRASVEEQLFSSENSQINEINMPSSLVVYLIESSSINGEIGMLLNFLLGPIQRLYYRKKDTSKRLLWKQAIKEISEHQALKECIENTLFNGEELSLRHYKILLRGANLSESSIAHMPEIKESSKKDTKNLCTQRHTHETPSVKKSIKKQPMEPKNSALKVAKKPRASDKKPNLERSLETIKNAVKQAENQFQLEQEY